MILRLMYIFKICGWICWPNGISALTVLTYHASILQSEKNTPNRNNKRPVGITYWKNCVTSHQENCDAYVRTTDRHIPFCQHILNLRLQEALHFSSANLYSVDTHPTSLHLTLRQRSEQQCLNPEQWIIFITVRKTLWLLKLSETWDDKKIHSNTSI